MIWSMTVGAIIITLTGVSGENITCPNVEFCDQRGVVITLVGTGTEPPQTRCLDTALNSSCLLPRDHICSNSSVTFRQGHTPCDAWCPEYYTCTGTGNCVDRTTVCDLNSCNGCAEDDEWTIGLGFQCARNGRFCRLPQQLLWDNVADCDDGVDLCFTTSLQELDSRDLRSHPDAVFNQVKCFQCLDGTMIVPRRKVCDSTIDCSDLSDECLCVIKPDICSKVLLRTEPSIGICLYGEVICEADQSCMNRSMICDGVLNCLDGSDEKYSYCEGTLPCESGTEEHSGDLCRCKKSCVPRSGVLCNGYDDCFVPGPTGSYWSVEPGFPEDECVAECAGTFNCTVPAIESYPTAPFIVECQNYVHNYNTSEIVTSYVASDDRRFCDGIVDCNFNEGDENPFNCLRFGCPSKGLISIERSLLCDGTPDCDDFSDEDPDLCPGRFSCPSRQGAKVSVLNDVVCDSSINCDDAADEMGCTQDERFYCEGGKPLFVSGYKTFDGEKDCEDWSDECPSITSGTAQTQNALSSRYELIGNPILRAVVWLMALLAIVGNSVVIYGECRKLTKIFKRGGNASQRANHMLVLNLAVADLLMGIYLLMLGVVGVVYSGVFCSKSRSWPSSTPCTVMGVLVVLSSETSVLTLVLLTASRLYSVTKPFKSSTSPRVRTVAILILCTWILSSLIALIPTNLDIQKIFLDVVYIKRNPFFRGTSVSFQEAKDLITSLVTYSPLFATLTSRDIDDLSRVASWKTLEEFLSLHFPETKFVEVEHFLGYYSANSVCIPNLFVTQENKAWLFPFCISIFNFVAFVFVAVTYVVIMVTARGRQNVHKSTKSAARRNAKLQSKILRLIATDFCCWFPLSIMVFINFAGVGLDSILYAVTGIILLPINSAFNPILYSNFIDNLVGRLRQTGKTWRAKHLNTGSAGNTNQTELQELGTASSKAKQVGSGNNLEFNLPKQSNVDDNQAIAASAKCYD